MATETAAAAVNVAAGAAATDAAIAAATDEQQQQQQQSSSQQQDFDSSRWSLHSQGAEARVWEGSFLGRPTIAKQRFSKKYRHPALDARLTPARLKAEVRSMLRARKLGVCTPVCYHVDLATATIYMERVVGHSVKTLLHEGALGEAATAALMQSIGRAVAAMHDGGLVHGDLTTSNLMVRGATLPGGSGAAAEAAAAAGGEQQAAAAGGSGQAAGDPELVVIDFGLAYNSIIPEDKAVDLYVLERAFTAAHATTGAALFDQVLTAYRRASSHWSATLNRFADVRTRGRKRTMVG